MPQWNLTIPEQTDRTVRNHLARSGSPEGNLSQFVDEAVRQQVFWETVQDIQKRNAGVDPDEIERLVDEAVGQVDREHGELLR